MTLGRLVFGELAAAGVRHVFGIPGDMALNLFRAAQEASLPVISTTNELVSGYAADFYARASGLGVLVVTYNVGSLSALNAVAEAVAERSPLLVVMGAPGRQERRRPVALHHEILHDGRAGSTSQSRAFQACGVRRFGPGQIRQAIAYVRRRSRPAFLEIPRDVVEREAPPETPAPEAQPNGGGAALALLQERLEHAERPVLIAGMEVNRFGLHASLVQWAERLNVPVVGTWLGKSAFPETHPLYRGIYCGELSDRNRELLAESDCVINVGEQWTDFNLGMGTSRLRYEEVLHLRTPGLFYGGRRADATPLARLLPELADRHWKACRAPEPARPADSASGFGLDYLAQALTEELLREWNVIVDVGDAFMLATLVAMPRVNSYFTSPYYASMGMAVPGALGLALATGRRTLVVVGDGAFQMTPGALVDCVRYGAHPIVVVLNNRSYGTLRVMEGEPHPYLRVEPLEYVQVARGMGCRAARAATPAEFDAAWRAAVADRQHAHLIEMVLPESHLSTAGMRIYREMRKHLRGG